MRCGEKGAGEWATITTRLWRNQQGQAMVEYVILSAVMVFLAAYLYHPNNGMFKAFRGMFDRQTIVIGVPYL